MIECEHFNNGMCGIATKLAGVDAEATKGACGVCIQQIEPMAENKVTRDLATWALRHDKQAYDALRLRLKSRGAGSCLHKLLSYAGIKPSNKCNCDKYIAEMDNNGVQWCRDNVLIIVGWLESSAEEMSWGSIFSHRVAATLVMMACDLAEGATLQTLILKLPKLLLK